MTVLNGHIHQVMQKVAGNHDEEPHTVASADGKFTKSRALDTDQEFTVTFNTPGEYAYFCTVHPHMTGKITVTSP